MNKSILQAKKECYKTQDTQNLHKHHIYGGGRRKLSDDYGLWIWLRGDWHDLSNYGVHFNKEFDTELKQFAQREFEKIYGHDKFMKVFGKNYL